MRTDSPGRATAGAISTSTAGGVASATPATADRQNRSNAESLSALYRHASRAPDTRIRPAPRGIRQTTGSFEPATRASTVAPGTVAPGTTAPGSVAPGTLAPAKVTNSAASIAGSGGATARADGRSKSAS